MINIAVDSQIPDIQKNLSEFFSAKYLVHYFESDQITPNDLKDVDALLVRSSVTVNKDLCRLSQIKYVGSATAGINHLDTKYLDDHNIAWSHAPGCNACSVIHYVMAVLGELIQGGLFNIRQTVGIVGYGNIGKRLYLLLTALNIRVYACDPFLSDSQLVEMDQVLQCDLVTIHVPYSTEGSHPTKNLINQSHNSDLKDKILINTSRGGIVSEEFVIESQDLIYIADVWLNEPVPSQASIQRAFIATPHIAGYSIEGKLNGSAVIAEECARVFKCLKETNQLVDSLPVWSHGLENIARDIHGQSFPISLFASELDLRSISDAFKELPANELAAGFKALRVNHPPRHDFNTYSFKEIISLDESMSLDLFNALEGL